MAYIRVLTNYRQYNSEYFNKDLRIFYLYLCILNFLMSLEIVLFSKQIQFLYE